MLHGDDIFLSAHNAIEACGGRMLLGDVSAEYIAAVAVLVGKYKALCDALKFGTGSTQVKSAEAEVIAAEEAVSAIE